MRVVSRAVRHRWAPHRVAEGDGGEKTPRRREEWEGKKIAQKRARVARPRRPYGPLAQIAYHSVSLH